MKKLLITALIVLVSLSSHSHGSDLEYGPDTSEWSLLYQPDYKKPKEVEAGSELRKSLFNLLRPKLEEQAKRPLRFRGSLRAYRNWAIFMGDSVDDEGKTVAYPDDGNSDTVALWLRTSEGWKVVDFSGGHSDAFFIIWPEQYGMPKELLKSL